MNHDAIMNLAASISRDAFDLAHDFSSVGTGWAKAVHASLMEKRAKLKKIGAVESNGYSGLIRVPTKSGADFIYARNGYAALVGRYDRASGTFAPNEAIRHIGGYAIEGAKAYAAGYVAQAARKAA